MDEREIIGRDMAVELMLKTLFALFEDEDIPLLRKRILAELKRLRAKSQLKNEKVIWAAATDVIDRVLAP